MREAQEEREAIVAWLMKHWEGALSANLNTQACARNFAAAIANGDHHRSATDED